MARSLSDWLVLGGRIAVRLGVVALVSADAETAVALGLLLAAGFAVFPGSRLVSALGPLRSRSSPRRRLALGLLLGLGAIVPVADALDDGLWLAAMLGCGYTGYRTGRVLRGAAYGALAALAATTALVVFLGVLLPVARVLGVEGVRALRHQVLFAPHVVGFLTLLWVAAVLALGGVTGLASGAVGGAIARVRA